MDETTHRPSYEPAESTTLASGPRATIGSFQRLIKVFFSPGEVFEDIRTKPSWLVVLIAMTILTVGAQAIILPHMDNEATLRARLGDRAQEMSDQQIEQMLAGSEKITRFIPIITAVVVPVMWAILAAIFLLMLKMVGSETDFVTTLSATLHGYWPASVVATVLMVALIQRVDKITEQEIPNLVKSHLGVLLPADAPAWLSSMAGTFSIFNIWTLALLVIGFKIVGRLPTARAAVAVLVPWAVWLVGKAGMGVLQGLF
jgi:hypothetical protein